MDLNLILAFIGASFLLTLMPGPDSIFVLTESLTKGSRDGKALAIGLSLGVFVHITIAATGLSFLLYSSAVAFQVVKIAGAIYLFYLAWQATKDKPLKLDVNGANTEPVSYGKLVRKGMLMNVLNPKVCLFFIAFLPSFITPNGMNTTAQMFVLGILFMLQALCVFTAIATLSGKLTPYMNRPKFWNAIKWSKTTVLCGLGLFLAVSKK